MSVMYWLAAILAILLFIYLIYALFQPEKF